MDTSATVTTAAGDLPAAPVTPPLAAVVDGDDVKAFVNPRTGELVGPDATFAELADYLELIRHVAAELAMVDRHVSGWIVAAMDRATTWTHETPTGKLSSSSPTSSPRYDEAKLRRAVARLEKAGAISPEAARAVFVQPPAPPVPPEKVSAAAIGKLRKLGPRISGILDRCIVGTAKDGERKVKLEAQ